MAAADKRHLLLVENEDEKQNRVDSVLLQNLPLLTRRNQNLEVLVEEAEPVRPSSVTSGRRSFCISRALTSSLQPLGTSTPCWTAVLRSGPAAQRHVSFQQSGEGEGPEAAYLAAGHPHHRNAVTETRVIPSVPAEPLTFMGGGEARPAVEQK